MGTEALLRLEPGPRSIIANVLPPFSADFPARKVAYAANHILWTEQLEKVTGLEGSSGTQKVRRGMHAFMLEQAVATGSAGDFFTPVGFGLSAGMIFNVPVTTEESTAYVVATMNGFYQIAFDTTPSAIHEGLTVAHDRANGPHRLEFELQRIRYGEKTSIAQRA